MGIVNLVLDTCAFLWLAGEPTRLSDVATEALNDPLNSLHLGDVSIWEICLKYFRGKLPLPDEPRRWVTEQLAFFHIKSLPLSHDAIFRSGELPRVHADPFDRLIAAQAIESGMTILSPDMPLSLLGASRIW